MVSKTIATTAIISGVVSAGLTYLAVPSKEVESTISSLEEFFIRTCQAEEVMYQELKNVKAYKYGDPSWKEEDGFGDFKNEDWYFLPPDERTRQWRSEMCDRFKKGLDTFNAKANEEHKQAVARGWKKIVDKGLLK